MSLEPTDAVDVDRRAGPACGAEREVCWNVKAKKPGNHRLSFQVGDQTVAKELAVGDGFMRVSTERPGWDWDVDPAEPLGKAVPARRSGPIDRDRVSRALVVDERHVV